MIDHSRELLQSKDFRPKQNRNAPHSVLAGTWKFQPDRKQLKNTDWPKNRRYLGFRLDKDQKLVCTARQKISSGEIFLLHYFSSLS